MKKRSRPEALRYRAALYGLTVDSHAPDGVRFYTFYTEAFRRSLFVAHGIKEAEVFLEGYINGKGYISGSIQVPLSH